MTDIYWFQNDLRLEDNPGLLEHQHAEQLLLVYCWPVSRPWCNVTGIGPQRRRFVLESLAELSSQLAELGQSLLVLPGSPHTQLPALARRIGASQIGTSLSPGYYERQTREHLHQVLDIPLHVHPGNTLFTQDQLPSAGGRLPKHFTPFKRAVSECSFSPPGPSPETLPAPPRPPFPALESPSCRAAIALPVRGGSAAGEQRMQRWIFEQQAIRNYAQTRNTLDGLGGSSTLSPWLALGCLSARQVASAIQRFEQAEVSNESTRWLYDELLWREFFHWRALADDISLFQAGSSPGKLKHCTFEPRNFARWCQGDTNFPLVNALMHQLLATGWMSNRGRQIAASCLINELGIDWRYGAAFFEKHLLDYDVASNYGNWQYIAGAGADPRGGRHFNQEKQAAEHDPEGVFIRKWAGARPQQPDFVVDAADWPLA